MPLYYAGIDEAGYGPMLGPMCVACAMFRVEHWAEGEKPPDLWDTLSAGVCKAVRGSRGRIAIADSKKLKLSNSLKTKHPLTHLDRGVLATLGTLDGPGRDGHDVRDDASLHAALGCGLEPLPWYAGEPLPLPVAHSAEQIAIASNQVRASMESAGVELVGLWCEVVGESAFNRIVSEERSKAATTLFTLSAHVQRVLAGFGQAGTPIKVVADRLGGRVEYASVLPKWIEGATVSPVMQRPEASVYDLATPTGACRLLLQPEAEEKHLPVALASMTAKYVRELAMARFNRYWSARIADLKPTAGYTTDARRWLQDANPDARARRAMVRLA